jgi:hypothetical protein
MRWILVVTLAACGHGSGGGNGGIGADCHSTDDCTVSLECAGADDPPVCGVAPREGCADDSNCPGQRCHAIEDGCSADGIGSECRDACTTDPECGGAGFRCDAGACVAVTCENDQFQCAPREVCDPSRITASTPVFDRTHACFPVTCAIDGDCNGRVCVNGTCQDDLGTCVKPMLVP